MFDDNLLLVTSKCPYNCFDHDGGAMFTSQLVRQLPYLVSSLDVLFIRNRESQLENLPNIRNVDFIETHSCCESRFKSRLFHIRDINCYLEKYSDRYSLILIQHLSNAFGIESCSAKTRDKVVVFPMFTYLAYARSQENVNSEYIKREFVAIQAIKGFVCPSRSEANDLIQHYGVNSRQIACVPRGIDQNIFIPIKRVFNTNNKLELLYIGTIKPQKNQLEALNVLEELQKLGVHSKLHLVGFIGDQQYYYKLQNEIYRRHICSDVIYHINVTPSEVARITGSCHIAISVSRWETFGRGIFEGLYTGLPTIAYEDIDCIWEYLSDSEGAVSVPRSSKAMAVQIAKIFRSPETYYYMAKEAVNSVKYLDEKSSINELYLQSKRLLFSSNNNISMITTDGTFVYDGSNSRDSTMLWRAHN